MTIAIKNKEWIPDPVSNFTLNRDSGGITWSFNGAAARDNRQNPLAVKKSDLAQSVPVILGEIPEILGDSTIIHDGIKIKAANSLDVGIPNSLSFTAGVGLFITRDLTQLCGIEGFQECEIGLVVQRTTVEPDTASRPVFSKWHDHTSGPNPLSLTYQFSDVLQTELLNPNGQAVSAPDRSLIRMGSGITHRSQTNLTGQTLLRTWAAFLVYDGPTRPLRGVHTPYNNALSKGNTVDGIPDASGLSGYDGFRPSPSPTPLFV